MKEKMFVPLSSNMLFQSPESLKLNQKKVTNLGNEDLRMKNPLSPEENVCYLGWGHLASSVSQPTTLARIS